MFIYKHILKVYLSITNTQIQIQMKFLKSFDKRSEIEWRVQYCLLTGRNLRSALTFKIFNSKLSVKLRLQS